MYVYLRTNVWVLEVTEGQRRGLCAVDVCNIGTDDERWESFGLDALQQPRLRQREEPREAARTATTAPDRTRTGTRSPDQW